MSQPSTRRAKGSRPTEPPQPLPAVGSYRLTTENTDRHEILDAYKADGVLAIIVRPERGSEKASAHLLQTAPGSSMFLCSVGSQSTEPGTIGLGAELTLNQEAILPCEVRAFENAAWEKAESCLCYAIVIGDHGETTAIGTGATDEDAWDDACRIDGDTRADLELEGHRLVPITADQFDRISNGELSAFSPDLSAYALSAPASTPSYLQADGGSEDEPTASLAI